MNEFCSNTGYHRKYAIRLLNGPRPERRWKPRKRQPGLSYGAETLAVLTAVWEANGCEKAVRTAATTTNLRLHFKCLDNPSCGYILRWLDRKATLG